MKYHYGLVGYPVAHSLSAAYFEQLFATLGLREHEYRLYPLPDIAELPLLLSQQRPALRGFNVTIPHKRSIIDFIDTLHPIAQATQAVNTVVVHPDGRLSGYNTDVPGFQQSIERYLDSGHVQALILGTGGAAQAARYALQELGLRTTFVSRSPTSDGLLGYDDLSEAVVSAYTVVVNCTPVGLYPQVTDLPNFPYHFLTSRHLVFDMVYRPRQTAFLTEAGRYGAATVDGLDMLYRQAAAAWDIWLQAKYN